MTELLERPEAASEQSTGISVVSDPTNPTWVEGAAIEASVFIENEYVKAQSELEEEYAKYLPATEFAVVSRDGEVQGSTRLIFYRPEIGFKTLDDLSAGRLFLNHGNEELIDELDLSKTFEVGTLAAEKSVRSKPDDEGRVAMALYGAIYKEGQTHGCDNVLASFDEDYFFRFKDIFGPGVIQLGPGIDYMGSPTVPVLMHLPKLREHLGTFPGMLEAVDQFANEVIHD